MIELRIPDLGEGIDEGTVVAVLVGVGSAFARDQTLLEIETDKVTLEIPAPYAGIVEELCIGANDVVRPADIFARIAVDAVAHAAAAVGDDAAVAAARDEETPSSAGVTAVSLTLPMAVTPPPVNAVGIDRLRSDEAVLAAGPSARREARELGIELRAVRAAGGRRRITREDVRAHARARLSTGVATAAPATEPLPDLSAFGPIHEEALSRMDLAMVRTMTRAAALVPQAWVEYRADITALEQARREFRRGQSATAAPLTLTAVLCKVVALALVEYPRFNAALDAEARTLVYRDYVNVGVAVDTGRGLLVPVIKDVSALDIPAIATELARLSRAARDKDIELSALRGAGITLTNLGSFHVSGIQPIVNWPEVAIIGVAAIQPYVRERDGAVETRLHLPLTLGFDHRVINGGDAARFLHHIGGLLGNPAALLSGANDT